MLKARSFHPRVRAYVRLLMVLPAVLLLIWTGVRAPSAAAAAYATAANSVGEFSCGTGWHSIASPTVNGSLAGVTAIPGTKQLWAVGSQTIPTTGNLAPLIERWNGSAWSIVPSPTVSTSTTTLSAITALSASNAWAVGATFANPTTTTVMLHWNGSQWSIVPSPNPGVAYNILNGVAALAANNVWAVGYQSSDPSNINIQQLLEHWDGHAWSVVAGATLSGYSRLNAIARNPGTAQLLAIGSVASPTTGINRTVIERWNGTAWAHVSSPNVGSTSNQLAAITVLSNGDAWVVGNYAGPSNGQNGSTPQTLTEHFNGSVWKVVASPNVVNAGMLVENDLLGVAALSASEVFSVGAYFNPSGDYSFPLAERWNGSHWSLALPYPVYTPPPNYTLSGVTQIPGTGQVWAVGYDNPNGPSQPLIVVRC